MFIQRSYTTLFTSLSRFNRIASVVDKNHTLHSCSSIMECIFSTIRRVRQTNLFRDATTTNGADPRILRDQLLATRIYLPLLLISFLVLVLFTSMSQTAVSVTVSRPSLTIYQQLQVDYPNTLSCPCQQIAINYGDFLSIIPSYHQVNDRK